MTALILFAWLMVGWGLLLSVIAAAALAGAWLSQRRHPNPYLTPWRDRAPGNIGGDQ